MTNEPVPPAPPGVPLSHLTGWKTQPGTDGSTLLAYLGVWSMPPGPPRPPIMMPMAEPGAVPPMPHPGPIVQTPEPIHTLVLSLTLEQAAAFAADLTAAAAAAAPAAAAPATTTAEPSSPPPIPAPS